MTAEQVFRALILKQMMGFSYRELRFHLADSQTYRTFCRLGFSQKLPSKSVLSGNIKRLRAETLEEINRLLVKSACDQGIEKGSKVRVDCTVVETNIHPPSDSQQLWDCIRVLTRLMGRVRDFLPAGIFVFSDRKKRAKRRCREIATTGNKQVRQVAYRDLLRVTEDVVAMAGQAHDRLYSDAVPKTLFDIARQEGLGHDLQHFLALTDRVRDQTRRRVLHGESIPASEKIVSIFEEHTDVIRKDYRDTYYGHKICLTAGKSSMILDCKLLDGNPADATLALDAVARLAQIYGRPPSQVVFLQQLRLELHRRLQSTPDGSSPPSMSRATGSSPGAKAGGRAQPARGNKARAPDARRVRFRRRRLHAVRRAERGLSDRPGRSLCALRHVDDAALSRSADLAADGGARRRGRRQLPPGAPHARRLGGVLYASWTILDTRSPPERRRRTFGRVSVAAALALGSVPSITTPSCFRRDTCRRTSPPASRIERGRSTTCATSTRLVAPALGGLADADLPRHERFASWSRQWLWRRWRRPVPTARSSWKRRRHGRAP